jgi:hypothetical protein
MNWWSFAAGAGAMAALILLLAGFYRAGQDSVRHPKPPDTSAAGETFRQGTTTTVEGDGHAT